MDIKIRKMRDYNVPKGIYRAKVVDFYAVKSKKTNAIRHGNWFWRRLNLKPRLGCKLLRRPTASMSRATSSWKI